ncbi:hypothetical protein CDD80_1718 [Ophiocordyceps camponoti-rufipedis]|uniref:Uncharacterized protein n=1 Tax=Ophiocordyceps camponoti-rufipedis TaxID=2004952 RepID=A0A2C5Z953_9HYPO|nr:hypothetical protein CDD80_1718 [Ophiocordyceps camponoti-rufipedis]
MIIVDAIVEDIGAKQPRRVEVRIPHKVHHLVDKDVRAKGAAMSIQRHPTASTRLVIEAGLRPSRELIRFEDGGHWQARDGEKEAQVVEIYIESLSTSLKLFAILSYR